MAATTTMTPSPLSLGQDHCRYGRQSQRSTGGGTGAEMSQWLEISLGIVSEMLPERSETLSGGREFLGPIESSVQYSLPAQSLSVPSPNVAVDT